MIDAKAKKRLLAAKDVLLMIDDGRWKPKQMSFFSAAIKAFKKSDFSMWMEGRKKVTPVPKVCEGCAKGALFYAHLTRYDQVSPSLFTIHPGYGVSLDGRSCVEPLKDYFNEGMLGEIERAFEGWGPYHKFAFYRDANERLKLICKNIVKNKGNFNGKELRKLPQK